MPIISLPASLAEGLPADERALDERALAPLLEDFLARARGELPRLDEAGFLTWVAGRLDEGEIADRLAALEPADLALAFACRAGDPRAHELFEQRCIAPLDPVLARIDPDPGFVDEIKQLTRTKLLVHTPERPAKIDDYLGRGRLAAWVRVVAVREAFSELRRDRHGRARDHDEDLLTELAAEQTGPELAALKGHFGAALREAFEQSLAELAHEQRNLLRLHYLHGLTIDQLGALARIHRASAARRIARARERLLAGIRRRLRLGLGLEAGEFEELIRLVESRIDLSFDRLLADADHSADQPQ
ncbi:sigma-70 family RNA polymerase sigma factor [Nannocystaceae bacterium ST9]